MILSLSFLSFSANLASWRLKCIFAILATAVLPSHVPAARLPTWRRFTGQPPHTLPQLSYPGESSPTIRRTTSDNTAAVSPTPPTLMPSVIFTHQTEHLYLLLAKS